MADDQHKTTPARVATEQAREGEDTHQWIARLHRENAQKAAQQTTRIDPADLRDWADSYDEFDRRAGTLKSRHETSGGAFMLRRAADEIERLRAALLRVIQENNDCGVTGEPCRALKCSCRLEMEDRADG